MNTPTEVRDEYNYCVSLVSLQAERIANDLVAGLEVHPLEIETYREYVNRREAAWKLLMVPTDVR